MIRSDVWAFACITFYFLAGRPPFKEPTDYLIFQKILKGEYTFPEGFDPIGLDLVEKLLVSFSLSPISDLSRLVHLIYSIR